ncbi:hypothetical protein [Algoriphagus boritolerans]|uniref:hypothetical protein n=1 Tax=Algoriphagus boritolerans TaxID=308111 RepID=UPI002FCE249D
MIKKLDSLRDEVPEMTKSGKWKFDLEAEVVVLDQSSERIIEALLDKEVSLEATQLSLLNQIKETVATLDPMQQEFAGQLSVSRKNKVNYTAFFS